MESSEQVPLNEYLRTMYLERKKINPSFSLRAFAKKLGLPSGRVSELLSGKRRLTKKMAITIVDRLCLKPEETRRFLKRVDHGRRKEPEDHDFMVISDDEFTVISDWYHFAILSLMKTTTFRSDREWMAKRLRISPIEVDDALSRLTRLGFIEFEGGEYRRTTGKLSTSNDVASSAIRRSHTQSLNRAMISLEELSVDQRDITSITIATSPQKLLDAKEKIRKFRRSLAKFLEDGDRTEVFELNIQLLPLTIPKED